MKSHYKIFLIFPIIFLVSCVTGSPTPQNTEVLLPTKTDEILRTQIEEIIESTDPTPTTAVTEALEDTPIPYVSPDWFRESIIYEIFVRSFHDSNGDGIGDIQGIIEKLDYIEALGVDTIWLMPIHPSPSVHGYDVTDYYLVNPDYGSMEDLQELVSEAHKRDMKIILDFVSSHLSNQHPIFKDAYGNPESRYSDWFLWNNDAQTSYAGFANNREMPRFNHHNPEVVSYLKDVALFWLDLNGDGDYTDGIDGFRIDNATFPPKSFFVELRKTVKSANPEAVLIGEVWVETAAIMNRYFEDQFDALFDFPLYHVLQGSHDRNGDGILAGRGFPLLISTTLDDQENRFPEEGIPIRFLSNHDTNRIANEVSSDPERLRLAVALLASLPDPFMIYYGEEIGMPGQKGNAPYWDNYRREPMDWYGQEIGDGKTTWFMPDDRWNQTLDGVSVEEQENDPNSLLNFYRKVIDLRKEVAALRDGEYQVLNLGVGGPGPWGILRSFQGEQLVALYNFSDEERTATIDEFPFTSNLLVDILTGQEYPGSELGQPFEITLPPSGFVWLMSR